MKNGEGVIEVKCHHVVQFFNKEFTSQWKFSILKGGLTLFIDSLFPPSLNNIWRNLEQMSVYFKNSISTPKNESTFAEGRLQWKSPPIKSHLILSGNLMLLHFTYHAIIAQLFACHFVTSINAIWVAHDSNVNITYLSTDFNKHLKIWRMSRSGMGSQEMEDWKWKQMPTGNTGG